MSVVGVVPARSRFGPGSISSEHLVAIQRARLITGAVKAVNEFGYARTTVAEITSRSRVSRRTFYELFSDREDCLGAMFEDIVVRLRSWLDAAGLDGLSWRERVRGGLWTILNFFDAEPALARACVVQSARGGILILERRERLLAELAGVIDEGRTQGSRAADCPSLISEGLVGAVVSILYTRLLRGAAGRFADLQGELMAMIVLPYLGSAAARAERARSAPAPIRVLESSSNGCVGGSGDHEIGRAHGDPLQGISLRVTYRTVCVLGAVAANSGLSNRAVVERAGVSDQGQISKLLARLEGYGLLENTGGTVKGDANAWKLTSAGEQVAQVVEMGTRNQGETG
jgi:AcrR family transcriptional regulator